MSQIYKSEGGSSAADIETITGNSGGAVGPDGSFNINLLGDDSTTNNTNGITVVGNAGTNTQTVTLTNRITGTATTTDDVTPQTIFSFPLGATPGTYLFFVKVTVFNVTDSLSAAYSSFRTIRATGAAGVSIGATTAFSDEEGAMTGIVVTNGLSGNNATLTATGLAGKTINYLALVDYIFIS
jgi:hypothetical protein